MSKGLVVRPAASCSSVAVLAALVLAVSRVHAQAPGADDLLLAIDQQRASVVERIVARWGADLGKANDAISIDELRMRLLTLRADRLFAASLAGTEEGVREAIGLVKTTTSSKRLAHTKAIGDIGTDVVYTPVTPCRLVETRGAFPAVYQGDGSASHTPVPFAPNEIRSYTMQGGNGVCLTQLPAGITPSAVQLQVFGMPTTSLSGDIEILPQGAAFGSTATMVYVSTIAFNTVSTAAKVNVANTQIGVQVRGGGAHLAIDVVGYFAAPSGNGGKFFRQGGNAFGTTALLGSVDNQPVTVLVNTQPVMRYLPNATSPNIIGGHPDNAMVPGTAYGQTIAGGGRSGNDCFDPMTNGTRSCNNRTLAARATIGGGVANVAGADATISGGGSNTATGAGSTVGGGTRNIASGGSSAVVGGTGNIASDFAATVVGGSGNTASASATLAAGSHANAAHFGCFVWADGSSVNVASCLQNNQFVARSLGGFFFFTGGSSDATYTGAQLPGGAGAWSVYSDRTSKERIASVDPIDVLSRLLAMPIATWNWKAQDPSVRHMGPMAQDFHAAFGLGESDRMISTVDADGVALAAIQGLHRVVQQKDARIEALEHELETQRRRGETHERKLADLRRALDDLLSRIWLGSTSR